MVTMPARAACNDIWCSLVVLLAMLVISGCTPKAVIKDTIVLLQDDDGKVGQVTVTTNGGAKTLTLPNTATEVTGIGESPSEPKKMDQNQIDSLFAYSRKALPPAPVSFQIYFFQNSTKLTAESKSVIPVILSLAKTREFYEISIIGHTDTTGSDKHNLKLSLARAKAVSNALVSYGFPPDVIEISYYGKSDPVIPTGDNVREPRNRRVEVIIK
jgi:outer membrane protein OmpA-like peptidoglycan-associated protein